MAKKIQECGACFMTSNLLLCLLTESSTPILGILSNRVQARKTLLWEITKGSIPIVERLCWDSCKIQMEHLAVLSLNKLNP